MITFGIQTPSPFYSNNNYDIHSAKPTKHFTDTLNLWDQVESGGSEWARSITDNIGLAQNFNDFFHENIADIISITELLNCGVDRPVLVADTINLVDNFTFAGHLWAPQNGIPAIFDSNTEKGMVVYVSSGGHVDLAKADDSITAGCIGVANETTFSGSIGTYLTNGQIERFDWTNVIGAVALTPGADYYLSKDTAGKMTTIAPSSPGEYAVWIGRAITAYMLDIKISQEIKM